MKIKHQLLFTHGILVALSLLIVSINIFAYQDMESDAAIINRSGRLRALSYNMAQLVNRINNEGTYKSNSNLLSNLQFRINEFDSTLQILGNKEYNSIVSISNEQTISRLEVVSKDWNEVFKPLYMEVINNGSTDEICQQINDEIDAYVDEINKMVTFYSMYSGEKVARALTINVSLVFLIIMVTMYSFISTNKKIQIPMRILMQELKELSLIDEEVSKKIGNINKDEITEMTHYFNEMMYDPLTKTFNRRSGLAKLNRMFQYENRRLVDMSICFIDINGLKQVNDELGHKYGDELISDSIDIIKQEIREEDFIIRMGGDEFLIIFNGINAQDSEKVWDRINKRFEFVNQNENRPYVISISHGVVEYDNYEKSELELLIKMADDRMYVEKKYIKENLKIKIIK